MKKVIFTSALFLSVSSVYAAEVPVNDLRWNSVSVSYQSIDVDVFDTSLTGLSFSGTKLISDDFFVSGAYSATSGDYHYSGNSIDLDYNTLSVGLGRREAISDTTDIFGVVSYQDVSLKASYQNNSLEVSDSGYGLAVGVRSMVTDIVELRGSLNYVSIDGEADTGFSIGALYNLTNEVAVGANYSVADDTTGLSLTGVYFF